MMSKHFTRLSFQPSEHQNLTNNVHPGLSRHPSAHAPHQARPVGEDRALVRRLGRRFGCFGGFLARPDPGPVRAARQARAHIFQEGASGVAWREPDDLLVLDNGQLQRP